MVKWLAMLLLLLLWMQQLLLLGAHPGSAQDLTLTPEPALEWLGECPQRRGWGKLALGSQGQETGVEQEEQVRVRIVVACVLSRGRWDSIVPSALLLASELGRGERQDLALQACRSYWTWEGKNSFKMQSLQELFRKVTFQIKLTKRCLIPFPPKARTWLTVCTTLYR